jgi:hypothetical protein
MDPGKSPQGRTVYLAAADAERTMVSYIQSNYRGFGSGIVVPGTGVALNNRGACFSLDPAIRIASDRASARSTPSSSTRDCRRGTASSLPCYGRLDAAPKAACKSCSGFSPGLRIR